MSSFGRKFRRQNEGSRSERVFSALKQGKCVDCGNDLQNSVIFDGQAQGYNCPECGWEVEIGGLNEEI